MVAKMVTLATIASVIGAMKGIMQISHMNVQTVQEVQNWLKSNVKVCIFKYLDVPALPKCNLGQLYSQITFSSYFVKKLHFCDALFNFCSIFVTICLTMLTSLFLNGPTSLKIVGVVGVLKTLVKGTFNVTL